MDTPDPTQLQPGEPPPGFNQYEKIAVLPVGPEWFNEHGIPMIEDELEPGWPLLYGNVPTPEAPLVLIGNRGDDAVGLMAPRGLDPQEAVDALERAVPHGAAPTWVFDPGEGPGEADQGTVDDSTEGPPNTSGSTAS